MSDPSETDTEKLVTEHALAVAQHDQMVAEIQQLSADLRNALKVFWDPGDPARERNGAASAVAAVVNYLKAIGIERCLYEPLLELWGALAAAEIGLRHPLTAPSEFQKGSSTALQKAALDKAHAAALVTLLHQAGRKKPIAYDVAAHIAGIPRKQLREFRKNIIGPEPRAPEIAVITYNRCLEDAARSGLPLLEQVRVLSDLIKSKSSSKA
jgi:hypothetical protein